MIEADGEGEADEDKDKREQIINKLPVVKRLSGLPDTSDLHYVQSCSRFACLMAGITFPGCSSFEGAEEYSACSATVDEWHSCFICHERSEYQCYCCPKAVWERCILSADFAKVKGTKGFCTNCIKVLLLAEKQEAAGSKGENVYLKDRNTSDALLYEYWLIIKRNENLGLKHLCFAYDLLKSGEIHTRLSNPSGLDEDGDEREEGNTSITPLQNGKRSNNQRALKKSKAKSLKKEYIGWGSKPLIGFLVSLGKDTSKEISQLDVASIINKFVRAAILAVTA